MSRAGASAVVALFAVVTMARIAHADAPPADTRSAETSEAAPAAASADAPSSVSPVAAAAVASPAAPGPGEPVRITRVDVHGVERTNASAIEALLPRPVPTVLTPAELKEFERRVRNLGVFDEVDVRSSGEVVDVTVQEKGTLLPVFFFASGKTLADSNAALGAVEFNAFGNATRVAGTVSYSNRAYNVELEFAQHRYRARSFAFDLMPSIRGASYLFPRARDEWTRTRYGGVIAAHLPYWYGSAFRFSVGLESFYERTSDIYSRRPPPDGTFAGGYGEVAFDAHTFHDLVPHGFRVGMSAGGGTFLPRNELRVRADVKLLVSIPLWTDAVIMFNGYGALLRVTNPNFAEDINSGGIRGLRGSIYHADAIGYVNTELRQSYLFTKRWAVQAVPLLDVGTFRTVSPSGASERFVSALSFGLGFRLVPTLFSGAVLRVDTVRMVAPDEGYVLLSSFEQFF